MTTHDQYNEAWAAWKPKISATVSKWARQHIVGGSYDDLMSLAQEVLWKSLRDYQGIVRGRFSTYFYTRLLNKFRDVFKGLKCQKRNVTFVPLYAVLKRTDNDDMILDSWLEEKQKPTFMGENGIQNLTPSYVHDTVTQEIVTYIYRGMTATQVAQIFQCSHKYVGRRIKHLRRAVVRASRDGKILIH